MKKYFTYLISTFIFTSLIFAQITESMVEFRIGKQSALRVVLIDVDKKLVEDEWKLYTKPYGKYNKKKGEYINLGVNLKGLTNPVDWYMKLDKDKKNIILKLGILSNSEFLTSSNQSENYTTIENFLEGFVFAVEKAKIKAEYETERKAHGKLQKKLKKLKEDYNSNNKAIEKYTKKIKNTEKDNKSNLKKQANTKTEISEQGLIVEGILSSPSDSINEGEVSPEYEEANKKLLKLQKNLEKLVGRHEANLKSIDKLIKKIEKAEKSNKSILKDESKTKKKISEQGKVVDQLRRKLEAMR
ncbi:MAG: hypothetical protein V3R52_04515 [Candidatus Neomarinimicrobiota bacterium]